MIAQNKMKIVILSIAVCTFLAGQASSDGGNIYNSNPVQYSHSQPINYHYTQPQPHYGSQQSYNNPAGYHPAQQQHGANQYSEQYLVTAIKTDPAPPVVHYQPPAYKPESPFNGQSYIIEPSYVLKPFRPETTYHAQNYRPHNPAPAVYQPTYHAPAYPAYQAPAYPAPVYPAPAYQQQAYPAPAYQNPAQSSVYLVYSTPLLAGYSTQTASSGIVTSIVPSATQAYTASITPETISSSPIEPNAVVESKASEPSVQWSDKQSDANALGQKSAANQGIGKESAENEESGSTTQESIPKSYNNKEDQNSLESPNPPFYPIPANHTSKVFWKIPKTGNSYGTTQDSSAESIQDAGDKSDGINQFNQKSTTYSNGAEIEESSRSSLAYNVNKDGAENKESSEITTVDRVTEISVQGKLTKYEGQTQQNSVISSRETSDDNIETGVVELVSQVSLQYEKPKSGSSVYYEQGPSIAVQDVNQTNGESKELVRDQPITETGAQEKEQNGENNSEEAERKATPVTNTNYGDSQPSKSLYYVGTNEEKSDVAKETVEQKEVSQYGQSSINPQKLVKTEEDEADESNETTEISVSKTNYFANQLNPQEPAVKTEGNNSAPAAAHVDEDNSDEVPSIVTPAVTIQPAVPAYQIPYYPPRPSVPKIFRPKEESEEVELPIAGFGEKIKAFTKFAIAVQKSNLQSQPNPVTGKYDSSSTPSVSNTIKEVSQKQPESTKETSAENYETNATDKAINAQPAIEYPTEGPTFHASLFYKKPVPQENDSSGSDLTQPSTSIVLPQEEIQTELPYITEPLFYAQATEKLLASQLASTANVQVAEQDVENVNLVKEDYVPVKSTEPNYGVRIVAEKISRDQPVQVVNALNVYSPPTVDTVPVTEISSVTEPVSIIQMPVLAQDPMEKTSFYATQRIYTASVDIPGNDYVTTPKPTSSVQDQNPYVTSTYAYIEEAGLSAEYQKEIAAAQNEAEPFASNDDRIPNEAQSQTEVPDVSQEEISLPVVSPVPNTPSGDALTKAQSAEDVSSEVTSLPVTELAYLEVTYEAETVTTKAKPSEEVSSELAYAPVTQSTYYQEEIQTVSYDAESTPKTQSAEDVSSEVTDAPVTEPAYQEKPELPWYEAPVVTTVKAQSAEDVSAEVINPVTDSNDQDEATDLPDIAWTRYKTPAVNQNDVEAVTAPYETAPSYSTSDPDSTSIVVGTVFHINGGKSLQSVTTGKTDDQLLRNTSLSNTIYGKKITDDQLLRNTSLSNTIYGKKIPDHPLPCQSDKSSEVVSSPTWLFNTAALANVPLDSRESSDEDAATLSPTTVVPEVTTIFVASNEASETTTVASDGYKYIFKSRPTPNRFYETKTTTAEPSSNSTSTAQQTSRRPLVVIGKPVEMRKPINGRVYSRPSPVPPRKSQTLAQIKILPTRLRSSTSTLHLPNRRFFIGRSLMANEKANQESKEDEGGKPK
ncbi:Cuticle-like protein [Daphnia magna]|uniref:Cuticle-like protein n=1 Tax=Daphnia magna TaxID=35525 RepID=A0A164V7I3_9CRUS|nr:Cuticle-like protein [Daphnia magna]